MKPIELLKWRKENGYTQAKLAKMLNVSTITVYRWEKGMRGIPSFLHFGLKYLEYEKEKVKGGDKMRGLANITGMKASEVKKEFGLNKGQFLNLLETGKKPCTGKEKTAVGIEFCGTWFIDAPKFKKLLGRN